MAEVDLSGKSNQDAKETAFLVLDTESVPDGRLLQLTKFAGQSLSTEEAVRQAQNEARVLSPTGSDFLAVSYHYPVAVCVARVGADFRLQAVTCLDAPCFRPREICEQFWRGAARYNRAKLVTFNGRGFDLPLLELAAFRYGCCALDYFQRSRNRFNGHLDLLDWLTNYGGYRLAGGLNLLAKLLGRPGKMDVAGDQVYGMYLDGKLQDINDYCLADTLDTYFIFLRTRVLTGDLPLQQERDLVAESKQWIAKRADEIPALGRYLACWSEWEPWP